MAKRYHKIQSKALVNLNEIVIITKRLTGGVFWLEFLDRNGQVSTVYFDTEAELSIAFNNLNCSCSKLETV